MRLACQVILEGDTTVHLLTVKTSGLQDATSILMEGRGRVSEWALVQVRPFRTDFQALDGSSSDWDRIIALSISHADAGRPDLHCSEPA